MIWRLVRRVCLLIILCLATWAPARAATWFPLGPYGGDARSLAADPHDSRHLYLGTATGWLYESRDAGANWSRVSRVGKRDDLVIDHILIDQQDPHRLIIGAWKIDREDGGLYISEDGGRNWYAQAEMRGQSVRAMARSESDPREIVAGTLQGVFRSVDNGGHWALISPAGSTELHEVESLAVDPTDPNVIYAGTWHLPWKTADGGATWQNIKQGIIDDSDVFSIIVDPKRPKIVYASACSGIYKSLDAAAQFRKVQGIPATARRTRKLLQDPSNLETVYAGTTEGLYKTVNGGQTFERMTGPDVIINDVYVDPSDPLHVLLATDRGGLLRSADGAITFQPSNTGFSARQVSAYAWDSRNPATIYVGLVNDKATGGVFQSTDGGVHWLQQSTGLAGRDVFSLATTGEGTLLAGTAHGIFRLENGVWSQSGALPSLTGGTALPPPPAPAAVKVVPPPTVPLHISKAKPLGRQQVESTAHRQAGLRPSLTARKPLNKPAVKTVGHGRPVSAPVRTVTLKAAPISKLQTPAPPIPPTNIDAVVYGLAANGDAVYAATSQGLLRGANDGETWASISGWDMPETHFVATVDHIVLAAGLKRIALSQDNGANWEIVTLPPELTQISSIAVDEMKNLWVGGAEGVFYSSDFGMTWKTLRNLYVTEVDGIFFDAANHRVLVTASNTTVTFATHLPDYKVSFWDSGWNLRFVRPVGDHLIGATMFDGMVLQPQMVDSAVK